MSNLKNEIPIVFATNDNYLPYLSVALKSLINCSNKQNFYKIFIFNNSINDDNKKKILAMQTENILIEFVNVFDYTKGSKLYAKDYFSVEMFYRILIAEILSSYDKVLYLDCDLIIKDDIAKLYNVDISNNLLAAVKNEISIDVMQQYVTNILKIDEKDYFNSGVLLINTKEFKNKNIKDLCFEFVSKYRHLECPDQDVLNLFCYGKVQHLDMMWNFQAGNELWTNEFKVSKKNEAKIIHFTSSKKPWNTKNIALADEFWNVAKQTEFYEAILKTYQNECKTVLIEDSDFQLTKSEDGKILKRKTHSPLTFPFRMIKKAFSRLKNFGFKKTMFFEKRKIKFLFNRLFGKVDKFNHQKIKDKHLNLAKQQKSIFEK